MTRGPGCAADATFDESCSGDVRVLRRRDGAASGRRVEDGVYGVERCGVTVTVIGGGVGTALPDWKSFASYSPGGSGGKTVWPFRLKQGRLVPSPDPS